MVVVNADAVKRDAAMVVVADAAPITYRAVVHTWQLVDLALLAEAPGLFSRLTPTQEAPLTRKLVAAVDELLSFILERRRWRVLALLGMRTGRALRDSIELPKLVMKSNDRKISNLTLPGY